MNCRPGDLAVILMLGLVPLQQIHGRIVRLKNAPPISSGGIWHWSLTERLTFALTQDAVADGRWWPAGHFVSVDAVPDKHLRPIRGDGSADARGIDRLVEDEVFA